MPCGKARITRPQIDTLADAGAPASEERVESRPKPADPLCWCARDPTACCIAAQGAAACLGRFAAMFGVVLVQRTQGAVYKAQILADARLRFALQRVYYVGSTAQGARDGLSQFVERRGFGQQFFNASRRAQLDLVREDTCGQRDDGQIAC